MVSTSLFKKIERMLKQMLTSFAQALRTVPTIVIAHTFCAYRDIRISYGWCLFLQGYSSAVQNCAEN